MPRRRDSSKKTLSQQIEKLEQINNAEARAIGAEITRIKRRHIEKYGRPKPVTNLSIKGIASEHDNHQAD